MASGATQKIRAHLSVNNRDPAYTLVALPDPFKHLSAKLKRLMSRPSKVSPSEKRLDLGPTTITWTCQ